MDRQEIMTYLPHRGPMLLVDGFEPMAEGRGVGRYTVRGDEWFLNGHFPDDPIVPGVILTEMMAQSCGLLLGEAMRCGLTVLIGLDGVRFKSMVRPGDELLMDCALESCYGRRASARCETRRPDGTVVCSGAMSFAILEK